MRHALQRWTPWRPRWALVALLLSGAAQAATYTLPAGVGTAPFASCSLTSGTTYSCSSAISLANGDIVNITSPMTLNIAGGLTTAASAKLLAGSGVTVNVVLSSGSVSFGTGATSNVNITVNGTGGISFASSSTISGNLTTASGDISLGTNSTYTGNLASTSGAISVLSSVSLTGSVTTVSGDIGIGTNGVVNGNLSSTSGNITLNGSVDLNGSATSGSGDLSVGTNGIVTGNLTTSSGGITVNGSADITGTLTASGGPISIGTNADIHGNLNAGGNITVNGSATLSGDLTTSGGNISLGNSAVVTGNLYGSAGTVTMNASSTVNGNVTGNRSGFATSAAVNGGCAFNSCTGSCNGSTPTQCTAGLLVQSCTISYAGSSTTAGSSGTSSIAVAKPAGVASGDLMLAMIASRGGGSFPVSITAPAGWTAVLSKDNASSLGVAIYRKLATASEAASYTWTLGVSDRTAAGIVAFRGVDITSPINVSGSQSNAASGTYTVPSVTTTVANAMLVAFFSAINGNGSVNEATAMYQAFSDGTSAGGNGVVIGSSYATQASAGASGTKVSASNTALANIGALVALKPYCPASSVDHYELSLPSTSLACLPTTVTVTACANSSSPCTSAATTVSGATATLATSGATLGATTVTFNGSGVASTTLSYPAAGNGTAVSVTLSAESTAAANARRCCPDGSSCSAANSCSTTFNTAGFIVASAANGTAATIPAQTAGSGSGNYVLRAVKTNSTTKACEAALSSTTQQVGWALQCNNPTTCSAGSLMSVSGNSAVAIAGNPNAGVSSYTAVPMSFDANGNAPFSFTYGDVGQVTLWARHTVNSATLGGSTNAFVTKPGGLVISNIQQTASPNLANPAAANASGLKFVMAGESFSATVKAVIAGSTSVTTPNFGRETSPEGVLLAASLVLPGGGAAGTLSNATIAGGSFSSGAATVTNLAYSEVGIITLTPGLSDGSYLGAGGVTGTTSGNIGRFVPARFGLSGASVTHRAGLSCSPASTFSYLGENFRLAFTLTAQSTAGVTTQNYTGSFAKLDPSVAAGWSLAGLGGTTTFSSGSGRLSLGSATGSWSNGVASGVTITAQATRAASPDGPFSAVFGIAPADSDGVAMASYDMASSSGGSNDRATVGTVALRFGRLRLANAIGAADRALSLPVTAQHWTGSAFDTNALDSCTTVPASAVTFGNLRRGLTTADTAVSAGIALAGGQGSLRLAAPLGGRSGSADVALSLGSSATDASCLQPWTPGTGDAAMAGANLAFLRGAWCGSAYDKDPAARATFGLQRGNEATVYRRENY